jgi:hypothetical protein
MLWALVYRVSNFLPRFISALARDVFEDHTRISRQQLPSDRGRRIKGETAARVCAHPDRAGSEAVCPLKFICPPRSILDFSSADDSAKPPQCRLIQSTFSSMPARGFWDGRLGLVAGPTVHPLAPRTLEP